MSIQGCREPYSTGYMCLEKEDCVQFTAMCIHTMSCLKVATVLYNSFSIAEVAARA